MPVGMRPIRSFYSYDDPFCSPCLVYCGLLWSIVFLDVVADTIIVAALYLLSF